MDNYVIYPDARKVIQTLSKTHRLGIISDTWPSIKNQLRGSFRLRRRVAAKKIAPYAPSPTSIAKNSEK